MPCAIGIFLMAHEGGLTKAEKYYVPWFTTLCFIQAVLLWLSLSVHRTSENRSIFYNENMNSLMHSFVWLSMIIGPIFIAIFAFVGVFAVRTLQPICFLVMFSQILALIWFLRYFWVYFQALKEDSAKKALGTCIIIERGRAKKVLRKSRPTEDYD